MTALIIANTQIRRDAANRYCLNDLHQASGAAKRHQPSDWLRLKQTQELVAELQKVPETPEGLREFPEAPVNMVNDGFGNGTYAVKELVYAYAMWINAAFHLHVIRAYDALVTEQGANAVPPVPVSTTHRADVLVSASRTFAALVRAGRTLRMSHARSLSSANAATYRATGIDLVEELDATDLLQEDSATPLSLMAERWPDADKIVDWLADRDEATAHDIITGALDKNPDDRALQTRLGHLMKNLGWRKVRRRHADRQQVYLRPD